MLTKPERERRAIRGDRVAFIPQDALRALNPALRVGPQVGEPLTLHRATPWNVAKRQAVELLAAVHLRDADSRAEEYPHQFSGGMQQRAMIAMGVCLEPQLLIADEPTTALDVTVQAQVLQLLREIRDQHGTSILFITHDLGVVANLCDRVYVMYAGTVVEEGPVEADLRAPEPSLYTRPAARDPDRAWPARGPYADTGSDSPAHGAACRLSLCRPMRFRHRILPPPAALDGGRAGPQGALCPRRRNRDRGMTSPLLEVHNASRTFSTGVSPFSRQTFAAVDSVSFCLERGRTLGVVGEFGVGKVDPAADDPSAHPTDRRPNPV